MTVSGHILHWRCSDNTAAAKENKMELQELVERIQRWRAGQGLEPTAEPEQRSMAAPPPLVHAEPAEEAVSAEVAEEQISELDVEPETMVPEEATSEVNLEQIEEAD
jgi:hypothetical protein